MKNYVLILFFCFLVNATEDPTWHVDNNAPSSSNKLPIDNRAQNTTKKSDDYYTNFCNVMAPIIAGYEASQKEPQEVNQRTIAPMSIYHHN